MPIVSPIAVCSCVTISRELTVSTENLIVWRIPRASMVVTPSAPDPRICGIAISVLSALPWAPRVGDTYASLDEVLELKSRMEMTVSGLMPGPLSATLTWPRPLAVVTLKSITGGMPISSVTSAALSANSLATTRSHWLAEWPVCCSSSLRDVNSIRREVVKTCRSSFGFGLVVVCIFGSAPHDSNSKFGATATVPLASSVHWTAAPPQHPPKGGCGPYIRIGWAIVRLSPARLPLSNRGNLQSPTYTCVPSHRDRNYFGPRRGQRSRCVCEIGRWRAGVNDPSYK